MEILGIGVRGLDELVSQMVNRNLLEYDDYLLRITEKGRILLISENMDGYKESDDKYLNNKINPDEAWSFDAPYVPSKFRNKI